MSKVKKSKNPTPESPSSKAPTIQEATITVFLKKDKDVLIAVHAHVQPLEGYAGVSPYAWFEDSHLKELVGVAHEVVQDFATDENKTLDLRKSENIRILFLLKESTFPYNVLVPTKLFSPAVVMPPAAFVSEYGRRVLPFLEHPGKGGGFKFYHMSQTALHAFVDCYEMDSGLGVRKIMKNLEPTLQSQPHIATVPDKSKGSDTVKARGKNRGQGKVSTKSKSSEGQGSDKQNSIVPFTKQLNPVKKVTEEEQGTVKKESDTRTGMDDMSQQDEDDETKDEKGGGVKVLAESSATGTPQLPHAHSTPVNTRYGLRTREQLCLGIEPVGLKKSSQTVSKELSQDSGKATSHDICDSTQELSENPNVTLSQVQPSSSNDDGIFITATPVLAKHTADSNAGPCQMTPIQMLVSHLPVDQEEDLQCYLSQQVDTDVSIIPVLSDEEGEEVERKTRKRDKPTATMDPKKLFGAKRSIAEIPELQLTKWVKANKPILVAIFQGKEYSQRHQDFFSGLKRRASLHHQVDLRLFTHNQLQSLGKALMSIFCMKHMNYFGYVMSVIFPECLIRIICDFYQIEFDEAEKLMYNPQTALEYSRT